MCGRFVLAGDEPISRRYRLADVFRPSFNIAPGQLTWVVTNDQPQVARPMRWGFLFPWANSASEKMLINARSETAREKPTFRSAAKKRRCLIFADGFYEWRREGRLKQPYYFTREDESCFAMAGLWQQWAGDGRSEPLEGFVILTTAANDLMRPIHDRMPVLLDDSAQDAWLQEAHDPRLFESMISPIEPDRLRLRKVSDRVNPAVNNSPDLIRPEPEQDSFV